MQIAGQLVPDKKTICERVQCIFVCYPREFGIKHTNKNSNWLKREVIMKMIINHTKWSI